MPRKRRDSREVRGIALDKATWDLIGEIAKKNNTNRSNLIEEIVLERLGSNNDKNEDTQGVKESNGLNHSRSKSAKNK